MLPPLPNFTQAGHATRPFLRQEEQEGGGALQWLLKGLGAAGNAIDLPQSMLRDVIGMQNPFDQLATPFSDENRLSGRDLLREYGAVGEEDNWGNFAAGMGVETLLGGAQGRLLKGIGKAGAAAGVGGGIAGKNLLKKVAKNDRKMLPGTAAKSRRGALSVQSRRRLEALERGERAQNLKAAEKLELEDLRKSQRREAAVDQVVENAPELEGAVEQLDPRDDQRFMLGQADELPGDLPAPTETPQGLTPDQTSGNAPGPAIQREGPTMFDNSLETLARDNPEGYLRYVETYDPSMKRMYDEGPYDAGDIPLIQTIESGADDAFESRMVLADRLEERGLVQEAARQRRFAAQTTSEELKRKHGFNNKKYMDESTDRLEKYADTQDDSYLPSDYRNLVEDEELINAIFEDVGISEPMSGEEVFGDIAKQNREGMVNALDQAVETRKSVLNEFETYSNHFDELEKELMSNPEWFDIPDGLGADDPALWEALNDAESELSDEMFRNILGDFRNAAEGEGAAINTRIRAVDMAFDSIGDVVERTDTYDRINDHYDMIMEIVSEFRHGGQ